MDSDLFSTNTLDPHPKGEEIKRVMAAAINAVDPKGTVHNHLHRFDTGLVINDQAVPFSGNGQVFLIAFGKAAYPMAQASAEVLEDRIKAGWVLTKYGHAGQGLPQSIQVVEAGHPIPDEPGVSGARAIRTLIEGAGEDEIVLCLVSGGGSALLTAPVPGMSLAELGELTGRLLASGADIHEINTIRKHLSQVKGGHLAAAAHPARVISLILSDVVGDDLAVIASGPTVPDPSHFQDAMNVLEKYGLPVPGAITAGLRGELPETPKPGDPLFERVTNILVGTNRVAAKAALGRAEKAGFQTRLLTTELTGEAGPAGEKMAALAAEMPRGGCWVAGGETTVTLGPSPGMGGRNQELALAGVERLAELDDAILVSLATDGGDGPTDAAGAVVSNRTLDRARRLGLDPDAFLKRHDAYHFFEALGDLLKPGPTRTNVNDLVMLFRF